MTSMKLTRRRAFSLVELLAVVLLLAILAGVVVPLYTNTRRSAAARTCKSNIAAIAAAESAWALRNGAYVGGPSTFAAYPAGLVGAPEGISAEPKCPLDGTTSYSVTVSADGTVTITCPNAAQHDAMVDDPDNYSKTLAKPAPESIP
jgi:prepilin-type N-terminal cleavage/methylation domain-containing protein